MSPAVSTPCLQAPAEQLVEDHPEPYRTLRADCLSILDAGLQAVMPDKLLGQALSAQGVLEAGGRRYEFGDGSGMHVLVIGKASQGFARVAHERLPEARGLVVDEEKGQAGDWPWLTAGHPLPDEASLEAGEAVLDFVEGVGPDETLLVLLSGGSSSLVEVPSVPLEDLRMATNLLLAKGVSIHELNTVRKHLSEIKGGRLASRVEGQLVTLGICDVPHERAGDLGSGPTVADPTTYGEAAAILDRIGTENFPPVVVEHIRKGAEGRLPETPEPGGEDDPGGDFHFLATNRDAVEAAHARANELGYEVKRLPSPLEGEARVQGETLGKRLVSEGVCLLAGGETTVSLRPELRGGPGLGGRNQELALAAAVHVADAPAVVCGFGTDGIDGPTDAAGAIADGRSIMRGMEAKREAKKHLEENDAYTFFAALGDLIRTGPTGTNVMDLFVGLIDQEEA